jgi:putative Mn2+ efflux pump MntP
VVWSGLREDDTKDNKRAEPELPAIGFKYLIVTGLALSLDNLVIGFALSFYGVPIPLAAGVIAAVSVSMSLMGLELGGRLGTRFEKWSEELGGAVLILVGLALAIGLI